MISLLPGRASGHAYSTFIRKLIEPAERIDALVGADGYRGVDETRETRAFGAVCVAAANAVPAEGLLAGFFVGGESREGIHCEGVGMEGGGFWGEKGLSGLVEGVGEEDWELGSLSFWLSVTFFLASLRWELVAKVVVAGSGDREVRCVVE